MYHITSIVEWIQQSPIRPALPLMGYPGARITRTSIKQNLFNWGVQFWSIAELYRQFKPAAILSMMDLSVEAGALGLPVRFPIQGHASIEAHPVRRFEDLMEFAHLDILNDARANVFIQTVRLLSENVEVPVGAYAIGPFSLTALLMGAGEAAVATLEDAGLIQEMLTFSNRTIGRYARALEQAGASFIVILDPTAVLLSPKQFRKFCMPYIKILVDSLEVPLILHICGDTSRIIEPMCESGIQGISLDSVVDLSAISNRVPPNVAIIGNINPTQIMVESSPSIVRQETKKLLDAMNGVPNFVASTGCDLPPETPMANIHAFMEAVQG